MEYSSTRNTLLETQLRAVVLHSIQLLGTTTALRISDGPAKGFLINWLERPSASHATARISGMASKLVKLNVLRHSGYTGKMPFLSKGANFDTEYEKVFEELYESDAIDILSGENGKAELSIDADQIYIPLETLHSWFSEIGYFELQEELFC